ncbi:MAG: phosphate-starvation-inducible PsiE family protein [Candidatus Binatia bacterium]
MKPDEKESAARQWIARGFTSVEDIVYVGLGLLLATGAIVLLGTGALSFGRHLLAGTLASNIVELLDRILLILLVVELMYTVEISFREHALIPEPFLLVGLIAVTRRILVLTAELPKALEENQAVFHYLLMELGLLTLLIAALVASLVILRKRAPGAVADRA